MVCNFILHGQYGHSPHTDEGLREVFDYEYAEIAIMLGKSEAACRRSFSRAKQHLREHRPRFPASPQTHRQLLSGYFQAVQGGEMTTLTNLLSEGVTLWADGGGKIKQAALRPIVGRDAVARFSLGTMRFLPQDYRVEMAEVNGQAAVIILVNKVKNEQSARSMSTGMEMPGKTTPHLASSISCKLAALGRVAMEWFWEAHMR